MVRKFSDRDMKVAIMDVAEALDKTPSIIEYRACKLHAAPSASTIVLRWGSWNNAVEMAGCIPNVNYKNGDVKFTRIEMINAIKRVRLLVHKAPTINQYKELRRLEDPSLGSIIPYFGAWNIANREAGAIPNRDNDRWRRLNYRR